MKSKYQPLLMIVILLLAVAFGYFAAIAPFIEKKQLQSQQETLLESITIGDGVITVNERFAGDVIDVDFYDGGLEAPDAEAMAFYALVPQEEPQSAEPEIEPDDRVITGLGVLTIERIDLLLPVVEGVEVAQLKIAVGHVPQTAPVGEIGNAVIAGHRSYTYGQYFNRLGELAVGDAIQYESKDGETMLFIVTAILEVLPGDPVALRQPENERLLTLYTCTPIRKATHRLLVRASRSM